MSGVLFLQGQLSSVLRPRPILSTASLAVRMCCFQKGGLEKLNPWIAVVKDLSPEVLILVCDRVCENGQLCSSA